MIASLITSLVVAAIFGFAAIIEPIVNKLFHNQIEKAFKSVPLGWKEGD